MALLVAGFANDPGSYPSACRGFSFYQHNMGLEKTILWPPQGEANPGLSLKITYAEGQAWDLLIYT